MSKIPNPNMVFPNRYKTSCFIKNVITAPNITVGDYTYYDDIVDPTDFEKNNVLFNYPEFGDSLMIGKFCQIASGAKFIKTRFDEELTTLLLRFRWWDFAPERLVDILPLLCDPDLEKVKQTLQERLK